MIHYRKANTNDIQLIYDLAHEIWMDHYVPIIGIDQVNYMLKKLYSEDALKEQMKNEQEFTLISDDTHPIGYFSISKKDKICFLNKIYLKIKNQAQGTGTSVMSEIYSNCRDCNTLQLTVNRQNYKAINFYFKNGFKIKSVEDFDIGEGYFMNDFVMEKEMTFE